MAFFVQTTPTAEREFWTCFDYIYERSPQGAQRWVDAFDKARASLAKNPLDSLAPENEDHVETIRQKLFKTRRGLTYRMIFTVRDQTVHILHVLGPGQDLISPDDLQLP